MTIMRIFLRIWCMALVMAGLWGFPGPAGAAYDGSERIRDFKSFIVVQKDGSMTVTENITVNSTGSEIKRGIVREFPTTYKDRFGNAIQVAFDVREVLKNGRPEPYHLESVSNGEKVYIGQKDTYLPPGLYTYTITYRTDRQLGYFKDFDELYWNVTGNGWTFPIDHAEAVVVLPEGAKVLKYTAYTGPAGSQGQDYRVSYNSSGNLVFATTRGLAPREGLTIAVSWPKGVVAEPTGQEKLGYLLRDNLCTLVALLGLAGTFFYFLQAWFRVGRDPARGNIIPLFAPPQGFSPAAVRYLMHMGYDQKAFAAAVVDMAVKGYLTIEEQDGEYTLRRTGKDQGNLDAGEQRLGSSLFTGSDVLVMKNTNHTVINSARTALKQSLDKEINNIYFRTNRNAFLVGAGLHGRHPGGHRPDVAALRGLVFSRLAVHVERGLLFFGGHGLPQLAGRQERPSPALRQNLHRPGQQPFRSALLRRRNLRPGLLRRHGLHPRGPGPGGPGVPERLVLLPPQSPHPVGPPGHGPGGGL